MHKELLFLETLALLQWIFRISGYSVSEKTQEIQKTKEFICLTMYQILLVVFLGCWKGPLPNLQKPAARDPITGVRRDHRQPNSRRMLWYLSHLEGALLDRGDRSKERWSLLESVKQILKRLSTQTMTTLRLWSSEWKEFLLILPVLQGSKRIGYLINKPLMELWLKIFSPRLLKQLSLPKLQTLISVSHLPTS